MEVREGRERDREDRAEEEGGEEGQGKDAQKGLELRDPRFLGEF